MPSRTAEAVLVHADITFAGEFSPGGSGYALQLHKNGDTVHLGPTRGGSGRVAAVAGEAHMCPTKADPFGFLGNVVPLPSASGTTEFTALLPAGGGETTTNAGLYGLAGSSCVLMSVADGAAGGTPIAVGVIGISSATDAQTALNDAAVRRMETDAVAAATSIMAQGGAADADRETSGAASLDCMHIVTAPLRPKRGNVTAASNAAGEKEGQLTGGTIALIVCLSLGVPSLLLGAAGWWYVMRIRNRTDKTLEEARLIRASVRMVAVDPDKDIAAPPPPKEVLVAAQEYRASLRLGAAQRTAGGQDTHHMITSGDTTFHPTSMTQQPAGRRIRSAKKPGQGSGVGSLSASLPPRPSHRRVASRFRTDRQNVVGGSMRIAQPTKTSTSSKPSHKRSQTVTHFRRQKQHAADNARKLVDAHHRGHTETVLMNAAGRPISVKIGAPATPLQDDEQPAPVHPRISMRFSKARAATSS